MLGLPEGWESDYGGSRWFYRYKPTGLTQFQFPKPGDEFPQFFDSGFGPLDVAPEERLAIERQAKRRSDCDGDNYPENNSRTGDTGRSKVPTLEEKEPMSATGYFDTGSYMYFGPGTYNDVSPVADDGDTAYMVSGKRAKEAMRNLAADISPEPTPPVTHIQPVTTESVPGHSFTSESVELVAPEFTTSASQRKPDVYELHEGGGQMWSPLGFIAELASSDTVKCAEELTPIELDATSMTIASTRTKAAQDDPVELPTLGSPVERQPTTPKSTSPPLQHVEPNPLCSASFAQPPLKPKIDHTRNISPTTSGMVQEQNARASEGPVSDSTGHTKYQPWTPAQSPDVQDSKQSSRISMAPSKMSVLQSQDSELGIISGVDASLNPGQGVPDALAPPSGPRLINANVTPPQQTESSTDLTVGSGLSQGPSVSQPGAHQQDDSDSKCQHPLDSRTPQPFRQLRPAGSAAFHAIEKAGTTAEETASSSSALTFTPGHESRPGADKVHTLPNQLPSLSAKPGPPRMSGPGFLLFHEIPSIQSPSKTTKSSQDLYEASANSSGQGLSSATPGAGPESAASQHPSSMTIHHHTTTTAEHSNPTATTASPNSNTATSSDQGLQFSYLSTDHTPDSNHAVLVADPVHDFPVQAQSPYQRPAPSVGPIQAPGHPDRQASHTASTVDNAQSPGGSGLSEYTRSQRPDQATRYDQSRTYSRPKEQNIPRPSASSALQAQSPISGPRRTPSNVQGRPLRRPLLPQRPQLPSTASTESVDEHATIPSPQATTQGTLSALPSMVMPPILSSAVFKPAQQLASQPGQDSTQAQSQYQSPAVHSTSTPQSHVSSPTHSIASLNRPSSSVSSVMAANTEIAVNSNVGPVTVASQASNNMSYPSITSPQATGLQSGTETLNISQQYAQHQQSDSTGNHQILQQVDSRAAGPANPFPMLPGQVKPLPSQIGSAPVSMTLRRRPTVGPNKPAVSLQQTAGGQQIAQAASRPLHHQANSSQLHMRPPQQQALSHPQQLHHPGQPAHQGVVHNPQPPGSQAAFGGPPQQVANNLSPPLPPRPVAKHMTSTGTSGMDQEQSLAQTYLAQGQQFAQTLGGQPYTLQAALHGKPFNSAQASAAITDAGKGMKKWAKRVWQNPAMKQTTAAIGGAIFAESMGGDGAAGAALANQIFNTSQARPQGGQLQPQRPPGPPHAQTAPAQVPANPVSVQQQQQQIQAAQSMHQQQTGMPIGVQTPGRPPVVQNPAIAGMTVNMNAQMQQGGSNRPPQPMARPPVGRPPPPQMVQQSFASQQPGFQVQGQVLMDPTVAASASLVSAAFGVARRDERQQSNHTQPQPQPQTNPQAQPEQHEPPSETNAAADHSTSDYFFAPETTIYVKNTTAVADTTYVDAAYIGTTYVDTVQADTTQDEATYEDTTYMDTACGDIIHVDTTCVDTTYADSTYVDTTYVDVNYNETVYTEETVSMVSVDESMSYAGGSEWAVSTIDTDYSGGDWGDCGDLI